MKIVFPVTAAHGSVAAALSHPFHLFLHTLSHPRAHDAREHIESGV